jgi:alkane 1-monooxygenase
MAIDASGTVPEGSTAQWRDQKRYLWLMGLVVPSLAFAALGLHQMTGWAVWLWIGPIVVSFVGAVILLAILRLVRGR